MREIKFRAWSDMEIMRYNIVPISDRVAILITDKGTEELWEEFDYMQYTGLKDKNGKEIYEGDIVKVTDIYIGAVKFGKGSYYFESGQESLNGCYIRVFDSIYYEVIGNIYENPELLEKNNAK